VNTPVDGATDNHSKPGVLPILIALAVRLNHQPSLASEIPDPLWLIRNVQDPDEIAGGEVV
jgi:hypothetical protein